MDKRDFFNPSEVNNHNRPIKLPKSNTQYGRTPKNKRRARRQFGR